MYQNPRSVTVTHTEAGNTNVKYQVTKEDEASHTCWHLQTTWNMSTHLSAIHTSVYDNPPGVYDNPPGASCWHYLVTDPLCPGSVQLQKRLQLTLNDNL